MKTRALSKSLPQPYRVAVFLHIPRTGGTTIRHVMEANLPIGQILPIYGPDIEHPEQVLQRLHEVTRQAIKVVRGHISYGIHEHMAWTNCLYFTMVRNPIERVWSLWNYAKRHDSHHLATELRALGSLQNALEAGVSTEFNNGMCRQLSGIDGPFPQEPYAETLVPYGVTQPVYDATMDNLDRRRISVGTTEYFDAFLHMMCDVMKWPNRRYEPTNSGPAFDEGQLSEGDLQALRNYNLADDLLWQFAKSMCE